LKIGGNVWFEGQYQQSYTRNNDTLGYRTQMRITLDARQNTEYGLLRTVVDPRFNKRTGAENSGSQEREGNAAPTTGVNGNKQVHINTTAYIQLGGLTVGRLGSFFSNQFGFNDLVGSPGVDARDEVNTIAYTASLDNGITLTAAIEDSADSSRDGISSYTAGGTAGTVGYGNNRFPDAVLALKVDQAWGSLNLAAMTHAINYNTTALDTDFGYATQLGAKINLPMIGAGDYLTLNGVYSRGFNQAVFRNVTGDRGNNDNSFGSGYNGSFNARATLNDAVVNTTTKDTYLAKAYGGVGEFTHYFTPTIAGFFGGGYAKIDWDNAARLAVAVQPASTYNLYLGAIWSPVKGFSVVPEVEYTKVNVKTAQQNNATEAAAKSNDQWQARIRVTRAF
jgi:hypothetical protein